MKIRAVGAEVFHADGQAGGHPGANIRFFAAVRECLKLTLPDFAAGCASYNAFTSTITLKFCWSLEGININVLACYVQCSVSCGEGEQTRTVQCKDARNAPSVLCEPLTKPPNGQLCRTGIPCPVYRSGFYDSGNNSENGLCFIYMYPWCIHYWHFLEEWNNLNCRLDATR